MNNFSHTRNTRNLLDPKSFPRNQFSVYNYSTDAHTKNDMKHIFGDDLIINNLHLIPDPLKKNLADSVITGEVKKKTMLETKDYVEVKPQVPKNQRSDYYLSFATIANFVTGMFNNMGALFNKSSDTSSQYDDCFEEYDDQQMAPPPWQSSKVEVQNKIEQTDSIFSSDSYTNLDVTMNVDCKIAVSNCEEKLNQVRLLLSNKKQNNSQNTKYQSRRPKKIFVEPGSVEESYEDAFCTENCTNLPNNANIECYFPYSYHDEHFMAAEGCKVKTEDIKESMDIITDLDVNKSNDVIEHVKTIDNTMANDIVSACDDKINKLKALLQSKRSKPDKNQMIETPPIPIREVVSETSELQLSNDSQDSDYFNEVAGKFVSSSVDSDDSFQIVFADEPTNIRRRLSSDCESEDSIVFADTPENCYLSNDVFGNDESDDSDSENEDSGTTCKLSPSLSRTFGDLTDNSLYCVDEVDSANVCDTVDHIQQCEVEEDYTGLLLNEKRKLQKKKLPAKKVHFSSDPPKVHVMRVWAFAARQARAGHWERHALDRERFKRRIADVEMAISWVLKPQHRSRVVFQRFRPWWNAQRRKELAEKKLEEERKLEEEKQLEKEKENEKLRELQINGENTREVSDSEDLGDVQETKKLLEDELDDKSGELNHLDDINDNTSKNNNVIETKGPMDKDDGNICNIKSCIERDQSSKQNNDQYDLDMPQLIEKLNALNLIENDIISNENVT